MMVVSPAVSLTCLAQDNGQIVRDMYPPPHPNTCRLVGEGGLLLMPGDSIYMTGHGV